MDDNKNCLITIKSLYPSFHQIEMQIADYILKHPEIVVHMTVNQLAKSISVADSSIVRFCQRIGFDGFTKCKINIAQNLKQPEDFIMQDINSKDDPYNITLKVFHLSIQALKDAIVTLNKDELNNAISAILSASRIDFYGVGSSAPIAMDAYYRFMRIGLPAYFAVDPHFAKISASMLTAGCVAVGISHTGRTRDTVRTLEIARSNGAKTICITSFRESPITTVSDIKLVISTMETKFMKEAVISRIAHLVLLDSLYTFIAVHKHDKSIENLEKMTEILNEMRF